MNRTKNAMLNASVTGLVTLLSLPIQFINRFFLVHYLGVTYLGITSLYTNILSVLSLTDLGIGTAIVFLLYEPLANKDKSSVAALMQLYRRIYRFIAAIVFLLGVLLIPLLPFFLKKGISFPNVYLIYFVYLTGSASSYLFSYNQSLLYADQKNHVVAIINLIVSYVMIGLQIWTVIIFRNSVLYAFFTVFVSFVSNLITSVYVNKKYDIFTEKKVSVPASKRELLKKNVVGNMFLRISGVVVTGTDSILLSMFAGVIQVGYYANYLTITNFIQKFMTQVIGAVTGSIGNFVVTNNKSQSEKLFRQLQFLNFLILSLATLGVIFLSKDVITIWLGARYVISPLNTFLIGLSFYFMNYRMLGWNFVAVLGLAQHMKIFSVNEMAVNILASLFFMGVCKLGLTGVLLGTITSTLLTVAWQDPYIIYKYGFGMHPSYYFKKYLKNFFLITIEALLYFLVQSLFLNKLGNIVVHFFVAILVLMILVIIIPCIGYYNTLELSYFLKLTKQLINKITR